MPNVILPNLGIELPDVGSDQDTWGDILNADLQILDNAVQYDAIAKTLGAADVTLTDAEAASAVINLTGTLTANVNLIVPVSPVRLYLVNNGTTGAFTVTVKTPLGTGVTVLQGENSLVYSDGTNIIQGATSVNGSFAVSGALSAGSLTVTGALSAGSLSTASATITGGSINSTSVGATTPSTGAFTTLSSTGAATLNSVSTASATITGGSINNTPVGNTTPSSGAFTTLSASGATTLNGAVTLGDASGDAITVTGTATFAQAAQFPDGTAALPSITNTGDTNTGVFFPAADTVAIASAGAERARITSAGNLLVGTTADGGYRLALQSTSASLLSLSNTTAGGTTQMQFVGLNGAGNTSTIANILSGNENSGNASTYLAFQTRAAAGGIAEAARITSGGYFKASNTGSYGGVAGIADQSATSTHIVQSNQNTTTFTSVNGNTGASVRNVASAMETGATGYHFSGLVNGIESFRVLANGNVQNTNNSYGALSDAKLKENITDAPSFIDRFMQLRFVTYNLKAELGYSTEKQLGWIAQEVEQIFPSLVDDIPDMEEVTKTRTVEVPAVEEVLDEDGNVVTPAQPATTREEEYTESVPTGTVTKSLKASILGVIQGKVIQEQQVLIQDLMRRVAALEAK